MTARTLEWDKPWAASGVSCGSVRRVSAADDAGDGEEGEAIEIPEAELDEADLPALDMDDPEAPLHEGMDYRDLLDGGRLERGTDSPDAEEEGAAYMDVGLTIELDGPDTSEELAQVMDLDVGSLLTLLAGEAIESDTEVSRELGQSDGSFALNALSDMLLPEVAPERRDHADEEVGDDERFPAFEDSLIVTRQRPTPEEGEGAGDEDLV
jgi:hypothetical protein